MTATTMSDVDVRQAARFLDFMAEGEPVTFQTFDDGPEPKRGYLARILHGDLDQQADALAKLNDSGAGIFWMVNFGDGKGRTTANVTGVRCAFLDLDGAPLQPVLAAGVEPHAVVESSHGKWHVYWQVTGCPLDKFKAVQLALAEKFGGDTSVKDLPRVMRLPGFLHRKGEPFQSRIESLEPLQPYPFEELVQRLGLTLKSETKTNSPPPGIDPGTGEIRDQKIKPGGRHAHLVSVAGTLNSKGLTHPAILAAVKAENLEACDPPKTEAEVEALVRDVLNRYRGQHNQDPIFGMGASNAPADALSRLRAFVVTEEKVKDMEDTRMIWRDVIALAHIGVWAAPGNGGKTTIARLAAAELASSGLQVMFFQEDAGAGDLPALFEHANANGYELFNSTLAKKRPEDQITLLRELVNEDADLAGVVMFFDTLKKYLDLMSKNGARSFFALMRSLTICGATIVLLGHTNKNRCADGKLIFEGVGDVRNDVDELLYIESTGKDGIGMVTMTIRPDKVRCVVKEATFRLNTHTMEVTALPVVVDVEAMRRRAAHLKEDADLIQAVKHALRNGGMPKFRLIELVAASSGVGQRTVRTVVARYLGSDTADEKALWIETYIRSNNTRLIELRPRPTGEGSA